MHHTFWNILLVTLVGHFYSIDAKPVGKNNFKLTVVHFNDFHARYEETDGSAGPCKNASTCIGGFSRLYSEIMKQKQRENVIILNAGDNFQGTSFFNIFGWNVIQHFLNKLPIDAMTLGNHEFDKKIVGLVPFIKAMKSPIVVSNIDTSLEPSMQGIFNKSVVLHKYGKKIGIIGAIASNTAALSETENLKFLDEAESINKEAKNLQDCDIIIALTHSALGVDVKIAQKLDPKINLIVGGHSHSLLYNGKAPGIDKPVAPYPVVIDRGNGRKVLIVQASAHSRYLGNLTVTYDEKGDIVDWEGVPIYLSHDKPQDPEINKEIEVWKKEVDAFGGRVIGTVEEDLMVKNCGKEECNIGNFFADSMVDYYKNEAEPNTWTYASIALINKGSLRTSLLKGNLTFNDLLSCTPFQGTIDVGELPGSALKEALEHALTILEMYYGNQFLQVSGLRYTVDLAKPTGSRVSNVKVLCQKCTTPVYEDLDMGKTYRVAMRSFMVRGGDGYEVIKNNLKNIRKGPVDTEIFEAYIMKRSPIIQKIEGRVTVLNRPAPKSLF